jgi:porphobilinogen synthase
MLEDEIKEIKNLGIEHVILFGIPYDNEKDACGSEAYNDNGIIQRAVKKIKEIDPNMNVVTDVCMCEYTSHGHCGILTEGGYVDNDKTLKQLAKIAVSHAKSGADIIAPSDMMDGRVKAIREALDNAGFVHIPIMSYSVKYASTFYGPFREAANSAPAFGDRKAYQMDPANSNEALIEAELDILEGADILMVKPALSYLDVIRRVKDNYNLPLAAYNVSGEYAMLKSAVKNGILSEGAIYESVMSIKRAGADIIITYFAKDLAKMIRNNK